MRAFRVVPAIAVGAVMLTAGAGAQPRVSQPAISSRAIPVLTVDGSRFRDLNRNGTLDPYEDWRLTAERRAADLRGRMTLEEKAGMMMHGTAPAPFGGPPGTGYDQAAAERIILGSHVTSLITRLGGPAAFLAEQSNALQAIAERSRLGIPLTISTDPRHHFQYTFGATNEAGQFSKWPETLGLAAIGDASLVRRFGDIARQEYRAVGITMALSPQADLATEPRWPRSSGTFGEEPALVRAMVQAYVEGFQAGATGLGSGSVATVVKHWVGYGAAVDGWDGHNYYGRFARLDGAFDDHVRAFEGAFASKVAGVMPAYTILQDVSIDGKPIEQIGGGYSRQLLTDLLRGRHHFDGVIVSDWAITRDCGDNCRTGAKPHTFADIAVPWGVESLTPAERFARGVNAGLDQFGGVDESATLAGAARAGAVSEARIDESVTRILVQKFQLGLFENPFVEAAAAAATVGRADFVAEAGAAQRRALVLLENRDAVLPLKAGTRVYLHDIGTAEVERHGLVPVKTIEEAQLAILRLPAPFEKLHPNFFFGSRQHEGRLDFRDGEAGYDQLKLASAKVPTIVTVYLDRPAILTNIRDKVKGLIANFGADDAALLDVLTGRATAQGRLPFELPSSMADVEAQSPGRPHDTPSPLYPIGAGLATGTTSSR
jgi:beta-glucosidase